MKIVIPIKQVPETSNVKMDSETGTMIREGLTSIINPLDLYAIEIGIQLKEKTEGTATAISMGPPKAAEALKEAIAMGCDDGILLSDRKFAGSDTWATSYTLAMTIRKMGDFDLILCGERATDGDTGQVGPGLAAWLDLPVVTYVSRLVDNRKTSMIVERMVEEGYETIEVEKPCLMTVVKEVSYPRLPTLRGKQRARKSDIPVWDASMIEADPASLGLKGSPTRVVKISTPKVTRNGEIVTPGDPVEVEKAVDGLVAYLEKIEII
ncbi:MAG: electron transfer flavoprotein subunit beta [Xanthomonadaceae bacterium]|nr:electron transfer flavoprotein subunit beta [Xanthomonadaceae bacterium]